jgi:hypothetical protein
MKNAEILRNKPGTHKPLVGSSNLPVTTKTSPKYKLLIPNLTPKSTK